MQNITPEIKKRYVLNKDFDYNNLIIYLQEHGYSVSSLVANTSKQFFYDKSNRALLRNNTFLSLYHLDNNNKKLSGIVLKFMLSDSTKKEINIIKIKNEFIDPSFVTIMQYFSSINKHLIPTLQFNRDIGLLLKFQTQHKKYLIQNEFINVEFSFDNITYMDPNVSNRIKKEKQLEIELKNENIQAFSDLSNALHNDFKQYMKEIPEDKIHRGLKVLNL